jgi:hypothetical protein
MSTSGNHPSSGRKLALASVFGLAFGFLLQKGGVAKFNVLIGALLLEDFTVMKVMLTAILVGMIGVFSLHALGMVNFHIQPTRPAAQALGGLCFGAGFALLAYCPGTGAAAVGQGSYDALFGVLGLIAGSYLFATMSGGLGRTVQKWGEKGELTILDALGLPKIPVVVAVALMLSAILFLLDRYASR